MREEFRRQFSDMYTEIAVLLGASNDVANKDADEVFSVEFLRSNAHRIPPPTIAADSPYIAPKGNRFDVEELKGITPNVS